MLTKQQLIKLKDWYYPSVSTIEVMKMSGWKFYIYGEDIDDSYQISKLLIPIAKKYDLTMKIATQNIINRNSGKKNIAWSIGVIYLHPELFQEQKVSKFLSDVNFSLREYKKTGAISGAKSINGKIHYRYDLTKPVECSKGVTYEEYTPLYRGESGGFNIIGNPDISDLFNK